MPESPSGVFLISGVESLTHLQAVVDIDSSSAPWSLVGWSLSLSLNLIGDIRMRTTRREILLAAPTVFADCELAVATWAIKIPRRKRQVANLRRVKTTEGWN